MKQFLVIILFIIFVFGFNEININEKFSQIDNIKQTSLFNKFLSNSHVNTLQNDKASKDRITRFYKEHDENNLPKPNIHKAFHYEKDLDFIINNYPNIDRKAQPYKKRPGAYGLTASFISFLEKNKNKDYAMWYEDDAIPNTNIDFQSELVKALQSLPEKGNDVYFFGYTNYCSSLCNSNKIGWSERIHKYGAHAVLFTNKSINILLNYFRLNQITLPIDDLIFQLGEMKILNLWEWNGYRAGDDDMICGLFDQYNTNCKERNSIIKTINDFNKINTISIIIPCIPRDIKFLDRLLDSIRNQTFKPHEVIICLSETDDLQAEKIKNDLQKYNLPLKIINTTDKRNASQNRNAGIDNSTGNILSFMDADDVMHPKKLYYVNKYFNEYNPYIFVHSYVKNMDVNKAVINNKPNLYNGIYVWDLLMKYNGKIVNVEDGYSKWGVFLNVHHGHVSVKREVVDNVRYREEPLFRRGQDSIFIRDVINHYGRNKNTFLYANIPLSGYIPSYQQNKK